MGRRSSGRPRKLAVTDRSAFIVTVQLEPATESHPFQPMKIEPNAALALSLTVVPVT